MVVSATSANSPSREKLRSRFAKLVRWMSPTKFDCLFAIYCLIVAVGLLDPAIEQQLLRFQRYQTWGIGRLGLSLGLMGACFAAVAVSCGWRRLSVISGLFLSVA